MFVEYDKEKQRVPIKIWLENKEQVEEGCLNQAVNSANLPFTFKNVILAPDCHQGYGVGIGTILATEGVIIPNAVGVDIACGMGAVQTNISTDVLYKDDELLNNIVGNLMRNIPTGMNHHKDKKECKCLDNALSNYENLMFAKELIPEIERAYYSAGTLGGGNHFLEVQRDDDHKIALMLHSGSRNFGKKICDYFNKLAVQLNQKWYSKVSKETQLSFLPIDTTEGKSYIDWMNLAMEFAYENRRQMMEVAKNTLCNMVKKYADVSRIEFKDEVNCHHNYAAIEHHFGKDVWVHRKGAIRARKDEMGIIPGAMGGYSYIVKGKGCEESFMSASHGAGRAYSRTKAKELFSVQSVIEELKRHGVVLGKNNKEDVAEECKGAYKDIDFVMSQQTDLVEIIRRVKTIAVIKG